MAKQPPPRPTRTPERPARKERNAAKAQRRRRAYWAWAAAGLVVLGLIAFAVRSKLSGSDNGVAVIDGVRCDVTEQLVYHIHAHLTIYDAGKSVTVPAGIGIDQKDKCIYWLHTHDTTGVIHVESPTEKQYGLKNFLDIWGQAVGSTTFLTHAIATGHSVRAYVGDTLYSGDPGSVVLTPHKVITLEYGPPWVTPASAYSFAAGE